jgi:preprotein translocase subunit SecG
MKVQFWLHLLAFYLFMSCSTSFAQQPKQNDQSIERILVFMDTLFSPAANSEGFLIIKLQDLDVLKKQIQLEVKSLQASVADERSLSKDSTTQSSALLENTRKQVPKTISQNGISNQLYLVLAGFFLLVSVILAYIYFRNQKKVEEFKNRLIDVENEFSNYKSTMIDRERKLMRELIDARKSNS